MKRIGIGFAGDLSCKEMVEYVKLAEEKGYDSAWMAEDCYFRDGVSPLAAFATLTEKIKLGTGVISIFARNAPLMAMTYSTLDELSNGRAMIGLGTGIPLWNQQMGAEHKKPLSKMREYVDTLRKIFAGQSPRPPAEGVKLSFEPLRKNIPIYIAAMGPKMAQLAGEVADGILLGAGVYTPKYVKFVVENVKIGAEKAGRNPEDVDIAKLEIWSVANDPEEAKRPIKPLILFEHAFFYYEHWPWIHEMMGVSREELSPMREAALKGDMDKALANIPNRLIEEAAIHGTPEIVKQKLDRSREAGLKLPVLVPYGKDIKAIVEAAI